jgi:hypothetical protein
MTNDADTELSEGEPQPTEAVDLSAASPSASGEPAGDTVEALDLTAELGGRTEPVAPPAVSVRVAERREGMRGILAGALVAILAATTLLGFASVGFDWASPEEARELLAVLLTPIVGLVGAATGFYFGGNSDQ